MTAQAYSRTPSLAEVMRAALDTRLLDVHVALPGKITKYDAAKQVADVKPLIKRRVLASDGTELEPEALPVIPSVPIMFPRSLGYFLSFPLAVGDHVLLVFNERSIDNYMVGQAGVDSDPDDFTTHDLSDAVAFPGFYPFESALAEVDTDKLVLGKDQGLQVRVGDSLIEAGTTGGTLDFVALAAKVKASLDEIKTDINNLKTAVGGWVPVPNDGGAALKAALTTWFGAPLTQPTDPKATKVKAE